MKKPLPLKIPRGGFVEPFAFGPASVTRLSKWLDSNQIESLRQCAEISISIIQDDRGNPTLGEQRRVLATAGELALALAKILEQAPPTAEGELDLIFHKYVGGIAQKDRMMSDLKMLDVGLNASLQKLPNQGRNSAHVHFVAMIANVVQHAHIKPSVSENSRFFKICSTVFESARIFSSPAAAIKGYIGSC